MIINMPCINDHEQLAANRERMIVKLRARLNVFENRYEMSSSRVRAAIDQGIIRETAEVTSWLMAWHAYGALLDERRAYGDPPPKP
jgi:hypothetical protein